MKLIYRASDINEANIVSGMLRANGIDAHVGGYYLQGGIGDLAAFGFANVHVTDEDAEEARILIAQYEDASNSNDDTDVEKRYIRFYISVILFALILALIFYYFINKG
jgi:hypothetical protein